ncbi:BnaC02g44460D [Brassica napus]|uniref:BnaC02g44460D protein n=2 Tax=Brassica TaxID=3705 RepID=A0A078J591_BRANA|nr:BnaC02g44460D [Brassica napus]
MFLIDMRDFFLNAPNGSANPSLAGNEKREADPSQYPLGEKTDVFDLPFRMARGQIVESLRAKMAFIKVFLLPTFLLQDVPKGISVISEATERERESSNVKLSLDVLLQESIMYTRLPKSKQLKLLCLKIGDNYGLNKDDKWSMKML